MQDKKQNTATEPEKSFFEKLGDQAAHVKEELVLGKDHLVEFAGEAIDSVKSKIQEFKKRKAKPAKKATASRAKKRIKKVAANNLRACFRCQAKTRKENSSAKEIRPEKIHSAC